jgi:putative ABC transport system ATP-binding protein
MVTHDPRAAAYADRAIFLKDGSIVHDLRLGAGSHAVQPIIDVMAALEL